MKAMISQPMAGKTDEEIAAARGKAVAALESMGYEVVNTLFTDEWYSYEAMSGRGVVQARGNGRRARPARAGAGGVTAADGTSMRPQDWEDEMGDDARWS